MLRTPHDLKQRQFLSRDCKRPRYSSRTREHELFAPERSFQPRPTPTLIVGIDIGTHGTAVAYHDSTWPHDNICIVRNYPGDEHKDRSHRKPPTELAYPIRVQSANEALAGDKVDNAPILFGYQAAAFDGMPNGDPRRALYDERVRAKHSKYLF